MQLEQIRDLVADDLRKVDLMIERQLASDVALVNQVSHYIVGSGGKRLRPALVLLSACAFMSCSTSPSAIVLVASAITAWMRMLLSRTIIWNAREYR